MGEVWCRRGLDTLGVSPPKLLNRKLFGTIVFRAHKKEFEKLKDILVLDAFWNLIWDGEKIDSWKTTSRDI